MKFVPHTDDDVKQMLSVCGCSDVEELFKSIPKELRTKGLDLPKGLSEPEVINYFKKLSGENRVFENNFLGAGFYRHYVPSAVSSLIGRAEFVTPYTPYQPELSQGTLQAIYEYQSMICRLTGMDVCNASHYDGATATAEAGLVSRKITKKQKLLVPSTLNPAYSEVIRTVCSEFVSIDCLNGNLNISELEKNLNNKDVAGVFLPFPNVWGILEDYKSVVEKIHNAGALAIAVIPEPLSLALFNPPSSWCADIVVGEGLSFGMPVNFGGPTLGIFACIEKYIRNLPGRLCGETVDSQGRKSYVLTLSTREQHIRRQKATSNICSNQALCATNALIYLSLLGGHGLKELAKINLDKTNYAKDVLTKIDGVKIAFDGLTFNEFTIRLSKPAKIILDYCEKNNVLAGFDAGNWFKGHEDKLIISVTENNNKQSIDVLAKTISEALR